ncbi:MAG: TM2 domain-containing protein [Pseudomonadota bacterium]
MSFGRKGVQPSQAQQSQRSAAGFGSAAAQVAEPSDPYAEQREAFLAQERARRENVHSSTSSSLVDHSDSLHQPAFISSYVPERSGLRSQVEDWTDRTYGLPHQRKILMAYFLLFMLGPLSMHRFYCGEFTKGMAQLGLLAGGLVFLFVFPPIGMAMLAFRAFWVFFDFLMIPGMLQRLKDRSGTNRSVMV